MEAIVSQPHLDQEAFEAAYTVFKKNLGRPIQTEIHRFAYGQFYSPSEKLKARLISTSGTLIDSALGVDAVVELEDKAGNVVERLMIDVTTNRGAVGPKKSRIRRAKESGVGVLADHVLFFERDGALPIQGDPNKPRVLMGEEFPNLMAKVAQRAEKSRRGGLH